jgi:hypothetical protein
MTCRELLQRFKEALERDIIDEEALRKLMHKCGGAFVREAGRALAEKYIRAAVSDSWRLYRGAVIAGGDPPRPTGRLWRRSGGHGISSTRGASPAAVAATYVAEAVAKYRWPAKWPFLAAPAAAIAEGSCGLPDEVAEALGPDEYAKLEAFLEQGEGVVEVAGRKIAIVRDGRYISIVVAV